MPAGNLTAYVRRLRGVASLAASAPALDRPDQELIAEYLAGPPGAAAAADTFAALLRRHGPMVYRVCWRVLGRHQDAEDAYQATFLVLARQLAQVRRRASLASWLHGVALRVARRALTREAAHRRRALALASQLPPKAAPPADEAVAQAEARAVVDEELQQLPDRWRLPLVLCDLQGRAHAEAARLLAWGTNTLRRRLNEARAALGRRLSRRGVGPAAVFVCSGAEGLPPGLLGGHTLEAAARVAVGELAPGPHVAAGAVELLQGEMRSMLTIKLKAVLWLAGLLALAGGGGAMFGLTAAEPGPRATEAAARPAASAVAKAEPADDDDELTLESVPPVVVKTEPAAGAAEVDAAKITQIKVTFSKEMEDGSWTWSTASKNSFPKVAGKPKFLADKKTCVLPVKLEPGKTYAVWLNSEKFGNFKDANGKSAVPYLLVFRTKKK